MSAAAGYTSTPPPMPDLSGGCPVACQYAASRRAQRIATTPILSVETLSGVSFVSWYTARSAARNRIASCFSCTRAGRARNHAPNSPEGTRQRQSASQTERRSRSPKHRPGTSGQGSRRHSRRDPGSRPARDHPRTIRHADRGLPRLRSQVDSVCALLGMDPSLAQPPRCQQRQTGVARRDESSTWEARDQGKVAARV